MILFLMSSSATISAVLALDLDKICSVSAKAVAFKDGLAALLLTLEVPFISSALKSVSKSDEANSLPLVMYSSSSPSEELNRGRAAEAVAG